MVLKHDQIASQSSLPSPIHTNSRKNYNPYAISSARHGQLLKDTLYITSIIKVLILNDFLRRLVHLLTISG